MNDEEIIRAYDPRLTVIDGRCYMCFAVDTKHGIRGGIAVTDDFEHFEVLSLSTPCLPRKPVTKRMAGFGIM